jgi:hypothetical protein
MRGYRPESQVQIPERGQKKTFGIINLTCWYHRILHAKEILKILPENTKSINIMQLIEKIPMPGRIHREKMAA